MADMVDRFTMVAELILQLEALSDSEEESDIPNIARQMLGSLPQRIKDYAEVLTPRMSDKDFRSHFRLNRKTFTILENEISHTLGCSSYKDLLMTLWLLATRDTYRSIADRFDVEKSTCWYNTKKIMTVIAGKSRTEIRWPSLPEMQVSENMFHQIASFPGVIGCVDGTHIKISAPKDNPGAYINRKNFHSILLQGVANSKLEFIDCYVGEPGSVHDARLFRKSKLGQQINVKVPDEYHLLGDKAYALSIHLLIPFKDNGHLTSQQMNFNMKLSKTRCTVERAFAFLKGRFRRLKDLEMKNVEFIPTLIMSCCVLHNICLRQNDDTEIDVDDDNDDDDDDDDDPDASPTSNFANCPGARDKIYNIMRSLP